MGDLNKPENFFYDSDEDVSWGPLSIREVKRDLKRDQNIPPNYRRQTLSFFPRPAETNPELYTIANSSNSSKDYFTANESLESNKMLSTEKIPAASDTTAFNGNRSCDKYLSIQNQKDTPDCSGVIELSSDSEDYDENSHLEFTPVKSERYSRSQSSRYNSFSIADGRSDDVICVSSSEDEEPESHIDEHESHIGMQDASTDSFEDRPTSKAQNIANTPVKGVNYSLNRSTNEDSILLNADKEIELTKISKQTPGIQIIAKTPVKRNTDSLNYTRDLSSSLIGENQNLNFEADIIENQDISTTMRKLNKSKNDTSGTENYSTNWIESQDVDTLDYQILADTTEPAQLNYSLNNFSFQVLANRNKKLSTPKTPMQIPKINIISNTPIKGPDYISTNLSENQDSSVHNHENSELSNQYKNDDDEISENRTSYKSSRSNIEDSSLAEHLPISLDTSIYETANISQNENEYDYCEEINHTLSSKLETDLSLQNSDKICVTPGLSGIDSIPNSLTNSRNNSLTLSEFYDKQNHSVTTKEFQKMQNDSISSQESLEPQDDSIRGENSCMNDTFSEMERLLEKGFDSDSDDSTEEIIDSTSYKTPRPAFGNSSIQNISRIPVPRSFSDESRSNSSITNEFKIPKFPPKVIKKTPVSTKSVATKSSPLPLQHIVSPVRLYINNSPFAALKQNNKPNCTKSQHTLVGISESTVCAPKRRRNLLDSLPEVVYKPSKLVEEKFDNHIILPTNIRKLITERIVIKHEPRKRINLEESMYAVGDKLEMRDLSVIVSDDQNMSIHTAKQGFNL